MTGKGEICNGKECGCKWLDEGLRIWHEKSGGGKRVEPSTHKPLNFYEKSMSQNYISFFAKVAFWWNKMLRFTKLYFWAKFWQNFFFNVHHLFFGWNSAKHLAKLSDYFCLATSEKVYFVSHCPPDWIKFQFFPHFFVSRVGKVMIIYDNCTSNFFSFFTNPCHWLPILFLYIYLVEYEGFSRPIWSRVTGGDFL